MEIRILGVVGVIPVPHDAPFRCQEGQTAPHGVDQLPFKPVLGSVRADCPRQVLVIGLCSHPPEQPAYFPLLIGTHKFHPAFPFLRVIASVLREQLEYELRVIVIQNGADTVGRHQLVDKGNGDPP